jgi:putative ABC transport system substrate-binding protein
MKMKQIVILIVILAVLSLLIVYLNTQRKSSHLVGIIQPMAHIAITDITNGIMDGLREGTGQDIKFLVKNAGGDPAAIAQIVKQYKDAGVYVFVPIFTKTAQITKSLADRKYIVFAAVTDPIGAGLISNPKSPESNITGVSDLWPIRDQFNIIMEILPTAKIIGILFDPSDPSSSVTMPLIRQHAKEMNLEIMERPVYSPSEVAQALPVMRGKVDFLFTANDVTITASFPALVSFGIKNRLPLFAGDYSSVQRGAICGVGQNYYGVGRDASKLIKAILGGAKVSSLPVKYTEGGDIYVNKAAAEKMGVNIPESVLKKAKAVYTQISETATK